MSKGAAMAALPGSRLQQHASFFRRGAVDPPWPGAAMLHRSTTGDDRLSLTLQDFVTMKKEHLFLCTVPDDQVPFGLRQWYPGQTQSDTQLYV
jgi:hypothetical protein